MKGLCPDCGRAARERPLMASGLCPQHHEERRAQRTPRDLFVSINDIALEGEAVSTAATPTATTSNGTRWSRDHDACRGWGPEDQPNPCQTTGALHAAKGRCTRCDSKHRRWLEDRAVMEEAGYPADTLAPAPAAEKAAPRPAPEARTLPANAPRFEVFTFVGPADQVGPSLALRKDGRLSINQAAYELLGAPAHVELLYASKERVLGIRAAPATVAHARAVRQEKTQARRYVTVRPLLAYHHLDVATIASGPTTQYGDVLAVALAETGKAK